MKLILPLMLFLYTTSASAYICMGKPREFSLRQLQNTTLEVTANGVIKIPTGTKVGRLSESYTAKGDPFTDLKVHYQVDTDRDDRNFLLKWIKPRELAPPQHAILISLNDDRIKNILGTKGASTEVFLRIRPDENSSELVMGKIMFNSDLSANCRP